MSMWFLLLCWVQSTFLWAPFQWLVIEPSAWVDEVFNVFVSYQTYEYARMLVSVWSLRSLQKMFSKPKSSSFHVIITMATERQHSWENLGQTVTYSAHAATFFIAMIATISREWCPYDHNEGFFHCLHMETRENSYALMHI